MVQHLLEEKNKTKIKKTCLPALKNVPMLGETNNHFTWPGLVNEKILNKGDSVFLLGRTEVYL